MLKLEEVPRNLAEFVSQSHGHESARRHLSFALVAGDLMKGLGRIVPKDVSSEMAFLEGVGLNAHTGAFAIVIALLGVLPRAFSFGPAGNAEFWVPINSLSPHEQKRTFYNFRASEGCATESPSGQHRPKRRCRQSNCNGNMASEAATLAIVLSHCLRSSSAKCG